MKKSQLIMIWLLPVIVIGGLFVPILGYLVLAMMIFMFVLSYFKGRYWCWNLCPRGAFLDIVMSKLSFNRPIPKIFTKMWFRWSVFVLLIGFLVWRLANSGGNLIVTGAIFASMCIITTIASVIIGVVGKARGWCVVCPMGLFQETVSKANKS